MPKLLIQILGLTLAGVLFILFAMFCLYHYDRELQLKDEYIQREYVQHTLCNDNEHNLTCQNSTVMALTSKE